MEKIVSLKSKNHGYGLENIKRIAKKYNGDMKIEYNEKMFMVGVVLYLWRIFLKNNVAYI